MALRGRRINNFIDFLVNARSGAMGIWLLTLRFHISDIGWPLQPLGCQISLKNGIFNDLSEKFARQIGR